MITPVLLVLVAGLLAVIAYTMPPNPRADWLRYFLWFVFAVLAIFAGFSALDYLAHKTSMRIYELNQARVSPAIQLARAIQDLSNQQLAMVARHDLTAIRMVVGDQEPVFFVRGMTTEVPWIFVDEFIRDSQETYPFLGAVRDQRNKEYAADITNLIVSRGWAERASGPFPAKMTKPLEYIAARLGVELGAGEPA